MKDWNRQELSGGLRSFMRRIEILVVTSLLLTAPLLGQAKRLWVLRAPGEMVEYDPATFAVKQTVKVPVSAVQSPAAISVNRLGQILYESSVSLPLTEEDAAAPHKVWIWDGHNAATIDQGVNREVSTTGSNQAITEAAPVAYLSADGAHLFWFANQAHRLQREEVDLSTITTWQAWRTDLRGGVREDLAAAKFSDCRCPTGTCEESCPYAVFWLPETGVGKFLLMTQFVTGQTSPVYKATIRYQEDAGKWTADALAEPLQRVLDAASDGNTIVEAIPDTGCCGWSNQSDDQTLVLGNEKKLTVFDELATYKNPDYDVSFYTSNARLSPQSALVAMTLVSTAESNKPIQLAEQGQASPEESQRIRKALTELPAVEVSSSKTRRAGCGFLPMVFLLGWISERYF